MIETGGFILHHMGMDLEFHHPEGKTLKPSAEVEDLYGTDKEQAAVFLRADGTAFTAEDLTKLFLSRSDQGVEAFVTHGTPGMNKRLARAVFPMEFPEGMIAMETEAGRVDVKRLKIAVELEPVQPS